MAKDEEAGGGGGGWLFTVGFVGLMLASIPAILNVTLARRAYPVHSTGAVLITGASTGIGNHAAVLLSQRYPEILFFAGVRKESDAENIKSVKQENLRPLMIDVAKEDSIEQAVESLLAQCTEAGVPLIGLVNNAGVSNNAPIEFLPLSKLRNLFEVNLFGLVRLTQLLIKSLRASQGRVVNVSSVLGKLTFPTRGAYCSSKYALEALSDVLRLEMSAFNVSVSVVEPAYVRTEIFGKIAAETSEVVQGEAYDIYGPLFYRPEQMESRKKGIAKADSPLVTTDAIEHALFAEYPSTRYVVANFLGAPAWVLTTIEWALPDRLKDYIKLHM